MTTDELEFLISQHFDGTLTAEESERVRAAVASDAAAKAMFNEYAAVDTALRATQTKLQIDEDWLSEQIGNHIDEANAKPIRSKSFGWYAPLAMAACLLIGLTLGVVFLTDDDKPVVAVKPTATPVMQIALGGDPAPVTTPGVAMISIGTPTHLTPQNVMALYLARDDMSANRVLLSAAGRRPADMFD